MGFARARAADKLPGREIESTGSVWLGMLAGGHHELPRPFGDPGIIEFIRQHHHVSLLQVLEMKPDTGHPRDPLGIGSCCDQLGPFPDPVELVQAASYGLRGHPAAVLGSQLRAARVAPLQRVRHHP